MPTSNSTAMLPRLCGSLVSLLSCGVATLDESGTIILHVNEAEAAAGGFATVSMDIYVRCGGERTERELFSAWLTVPPGVASGEVLVPSVELPGTITPVRFRVRLV